MDNTVGYIYILVNPAIRDYVKIGYATNVEKRLKELNNSEGIPFSFRVYATYEVPVALADKKLHRIIDQLNPDLRAVEVREGKTRKREFYAMEPEAAYNILRAIAELHGFESRLKRWEETADEKAEAENAKKSARAGKKLAPFSFDKAGVPIGAVITFDKDPGITAEVINNKKVKYEDEEYTLSALAQKLLGSVHAPQGPAYFSYEGTNLIVLRSRCEEQEEEHEQEEEQVQDEADDDSQELTYEENDSEQSEDEE